MLDPVSEALRLLGKRRLFLSIHDGSFPYDAEGDIGRGTPYGRAGRAFLAFARQLGFNGIQLGPQGQTSRQDPSPYSGAVFARNPLSIATTPLARDPAWGALLAEQTLAGAMQEAAGRDRNRVHYRAAFHAQQRLLGALHARFRQLRHQGGAAGAVAERLAAFRRRHRGWLPAAALFEALAARYGSEQWALWPQHGAGAVDRCLFCPPPGQEDRAGERRERLRRLHAGRVELYELCQLVAHEQHRSLRQTARELALLLYADLQIGMAARDVWALQPLFLAGYRMGAPPSRTNPEGQPWGYPVFDPHAYRRRPAGAPFTALQALRLRLDKLFTEYDGLRIDHPQGLVCPWVYRSDGTDPLQAVKRGARLFSSAQLPDHPALAPYAIARADQLAPGDGVRRYEDGWVRELDSTQVERYAEAMAVVAEAAERHVRGREDIACEVLSTLPYPLARVIDLYGLGRFRVLQKADLHDPGDVYRSENTEARDWIMLGTHDTPSIWQAVERWRENGEIRARAAHLAARLAGAGFAGGDGPAAAGEEAELRAGLARDPGLMVHALLAEALLSRAENVLVFFADLFGIRETFNTPGTVGFHNWSLRVPYDYQDSYPGRAARLEALNLPCALALALRARAKGRQPPHAGLVAALEEAARMGSARRSASGRG